MRLLLHRPGNPYHATPFSEKAPPLGALSLAGYVRHHGDHEVRLLDGSEGDGLRALARVCRDWQPDLVGLSAMTATAYDGMVCASVVRQAAPDAWVLAGGIHYTAEPEETLRLCPDIDAIGLGEGEQTLLETAEALAGCGGRRGPWREALREIAGLCWLEGHGPTLSDTLAPTTDRPLHFTPQRRLIQDLGRLTMPAWDLHRPDRYRMRPWSWRDMSLIEGSRGCPYRCTYCHNSQFWEYRWRARPVEAVLDEVEALIRLGHTNLFFVDDSWATSRKRTIAFCEGMLRRNLRAHLWAQCRVDDLHRDQDLFPLMERAGFYGLLIGYESPDDAALARWDKGVGSDKAYAIAPALTRHFRCVMGTFMVGDLETDPGTFDRVSAYADALGVDILLMIPFNPIPVTVPIWQEYAGLAELDLVWDYDLAGSYRGGISTRHLSREQVLALNQRHMLRFYLDPRKAGHALRSGRHTRRHFFHMLVSAGIDAGVSPVRQRMRARDPRRWARLREHYRQRHLALSARRLAEERGSRVVA